jgi:hypothetical protein
VIKWYLSQEDRPWVRASTAPLIERWNGRHWTEQTDSADQQTLIEHWNGKRWKALPSPNPPSGYLNLLRAASGLIVHWNGTARN